MHIYDGVGDVGKLGKAGKLAGGVFADVNQLADGGGAEEGEEFLGSFLGETDGVERGAHREA